MSLAQLTTVILIILLAGVIYLLNDNHRRQS